MSKRKIGEVQLSGNSEKSLAKCEACGQSLKTEVPGAWEIGKSWAIRHICR